MKKKVENHCSTGNRNWNYVFKLHFVIYEVEKIYYDALPKTLRLWKITTCDVCDKIIVLVNTIYLFGYRQDCKIFYINNFTQFFLRLKLFSMFYIFIWFHYLYIFAFVKVFLLFKFFIYKYISLILIPIFYIFLIFITREKLFIL